MAMIGAQKVQQEFSGITDEAVVAKVRAGEAALFEVLMRRYNQRLFRVTRSLLKDDAEAEDAMQEAYVRAFTRLDQFEGRASFATWLTKIAVNEALGRLRRRGRLTALEASERPDDDSTRDLFMSRAQPRSPEDNTSLRELAAVLERSIDELPEIYSSVVMLRDVEELSTAETAACLAISEEAVKVRLHRARASLRRAVDARLSAAARQSFLFLVPRCDAMVRRVFAALGYAGG